MTQRPPVSPPSTRRDVASWLGLQPTMCAGRRRSTGSSDTRPACAHSRRCYVCFHFADCRPAIAFCIGAGSATRLSASERCTRRLCFEDPVMGVSTGCIARSSLARAHDEPDANSVRSPNRHRLGPGRITGVPARRTNSLQVGGDACQCQGDLLLPSMSTAAILLSSASIRKTRRTALAQRRRKRSSRTLSGDRDAGAGNRRRSRPGRERYPSGRARHASYHRRAIPCSRRLLAPLGTAPFRRGLIRASGSVDIRPTRHYVRPAGGETHSTRINRPNLGRTWRLYRD